MAKQTPQESWGHRVNGTWACFPIVRSASECRGDSLKLSKYLCTLKPRPESGRDCLRCAMFARQRLAGRWCGVHALEESFLECWWWSGRCQPGALSLTLSLARTRKAFTAFGLMTRSGRIRPVFSSHSPCTRGFPQRLGTCGTDLIEKGFQCKTFLAMKFTTRML